MNVEGVPPDGDLTGSVEVDGEDCDKSGAGTENSIGEVKLRNAFNGSTPH